jgi:hypothetical protein
MRIGLDGNVCACDAAANAASNTAIATPPRSIDIVLFIALSGPETARSSFRHGGNHVDFD